MIPEAKKDAVARALRETFGVSEFEDIRSLTAGLSSALVCRIVVRGCPYLLRVITNNSSNPGPGQGDPTNQFACMREGAEAGIAPGVWYTSVEDRVSITDFVEARPFPRTEALARLPLTLRAVHGLPAFPIPKIGNYLDVMDGIVRRFQGAKILPESETAELFEGYARVKNIYPRKEADMVSCHNDLKPENILFDGDRVWLVDWEAAFLNDRYNDLGVVANFVVTNEAEEEAYLQSYFGEAAGDYRLARFYLMRQMLHVFYATMFLLIGSAGKPIEPSAAAADFRDFHNRIWTGELSLASAETKLAYGRVHLNQVLQNMRTARFQDALRIVMNAPERRMSL